MAVYNTDVYYCNDTKRNIWCPRFRRMAKRKFKRATADEKRCACVFELKFRIDRFNYQLSI